MAKILLLVAAIALVACGGGDDGSANSTGSGDTGVDATEGTAPAVTSTETTADTTGATEPDPEPTEPEPTEPEPTEPATTEPPDPEPVPVDPRPTDTELAEYVWAPVTLEAPWEPRAGLRVVELDDRLYLLGGRTPNQSTTPGDSTIWGDVWVSDDDGRTWTELLAEAPWPSRAYFQAVVADGMIYVIGGQDFGLQPNPFCDLLEQGLEPPPGLGIDPDAPCPEFLPTSNFFNDVWSSADGVTWEQRTADAPWAGRAGLSAAVLGDELYVMAGSQNDDSSIIGAGGPERIYYNDVWRSTNGAEWELATDAAPWEPRAGAATVVRDARLYLFGGEDGFTCDPLPGCEPPYFNDVWVTSDGAEWELLTESAGWNPRPGHVCELVGNRFLCFGGFGLLENPTDMWISTDGAAWTELPSAPWNAADPTAVKYDFDALVVDDTTVLTFGGDRETFDFTDPENYLRVDNDVWSFAPS